MSMTLLAILAGTLSAGVGSVLLAALLARALLARFTQHLLSLAAGALLATAFMHLLPEAFESDITPQVLFMTLLAGLVFFFLLDKAELWHHGHEHGEDHYRDRDRDRDHDHDHLMNTRQAALPAAGRCWQVTACTLSVTAFW